MAIYVYKCNECEIQIEVTQKMSEEPLTLCPKCNEEALRRCIGTVAVFYRTGGFYNTENHRYTTTTNKHGKAVVEKTKI